MWVSHVSLSSSYQCSAWKSDSMKHNTEKTFISSAYHWLYLSARRLLCQFNSLLNRPSNKKEEKTWADTKARRKADVGRKRKSKKSNFYFDKSSSTLKQPKRHSHRNNNNIIGLRLLQLCIHSGEERKKCLKYLVFFRGADKNFTLQSSIMTLFMSTYLRITVILTAVHGVRLSLPYC